MSYISTSPIGDRLSLRVHVGGGTYRTRSYSNVKPGVSDEDLHKLAELMVAQIDYSGTSDVQRFVGNTLLPGDLSGGAS